MGKRAKKPTGAGRHVMDGAKCTTCGQTIDEINGACFQTVRLHALLDKAKVPRTGAGGIEINVYGRLAWMVELRDLTEQCSKIEFLPA